MADVRTDPVRAGLAPAAIERALDIYRQMQNCDETTTNQAREILTGHVNALIGAGEQNELRLIVHALAHLKALDRQRAARA